MRETTKRATCVGVALAVFVICANPASAADVTDLWAKAGATEASVAADLADCQAKARSVPVHTEPNYAVGGAGGYLGTVIVQAIAARRAEHEFDRHCMGGRGYAWLRLTDQEQAALARRKTPQDRSGWIDAFYAGDLSARIAAAAKPAVPPLPVGELEPLTIAGVRLDPTAMAVARGAITAGEPVLSGPIGHQRTARLRQAIDVTSRLHADAGTIFQEIVAPSDFNPEQTYWCATMQGGSPLSRNPAVCFFTAEAGYRGEGVLGGQPWLILAPVGPGARGAWIGDGVEIVLDPSADDLLGAMDFSLVVKKVTAKAVSLEARAAKDGKTVNFWAGDLAFGDDGKAVLPFWTWRLVFTRDEKSVSATFTPDGEGASWGDAKLAD